jgi:hypothetical protein
MGLLFLSSWVLFGGGLLFLSTSSWAVMSQGKQLKRNAERELVKEYS